MIGVASAAPAPVSLSPSTPARPPRGPTVRDEGASRHDSLSAERWTARGIVKVVGEAAIGQGTVDGQLSVGGALTAETFSLRGSGLFGGPVTVRARLTLRGEMRAGSTVRAGEARLDGQVHVTAPVEVDRILDVTGALRAPSVTAGDLRLDGSVEVPGELRALRIDVRFRATSQVGSVSAPAVRLAGHVPNLIEKVLGRRVHVSVGSVTAELAEIVGVEVGFVEAKEIVLGRDASVTQVEGTIVRRHPSARVGPRSESRPPHGLRR